MNESLTSIVVSIVGLSGVVFTSYYAFVASRASREVNNAVNNNKPGDKRLYDLAREVHENILHNQTEHGQLFERLGRIEGKLDAHVDWEEGTKYEEQLAEITRVVGEILRNQVPGTQNPDSV